MGGFIPGIGRFAADESGPTAIEYAVMLAFMILVCFAAIASLGPITKPGFTGASRAFSTAPAATP